MALRRRAVDTPPVVCMMVGAFPPPVHGMSQVNAWVREALRVQNAEVAVIDLVGRERLTRMRLGRFVRVAQGLWRFLWGSFWTRPRVVYLSVSGGWGQVYDIVFLMIARTRRILPVLHHHSYAYLGKRRSLTTLLMRVAGDGAAHVVLCKDMERRLRELYNCRATTLIVSNAVWVEGHSRGLRSETRRSVRTIGYLSNIAEDKGIREFLAVACDLARSPRRILSLVAGPIVEPRAEEWVRDAVTRCDEVSYIGAVYETSKADFFKEIDVLVFPTKYVNEAEPLTVLEAMACGVPVIAWGRGCLLEMVLDGGGLVVELGDDLVGRATAQIEAWAAAPDDLAKASERASSIFRERAAASLKPYEQLLQILMGRSCVPLT